MFFVVRFYNNMSRLKTASYKIFYSVVIYVNQRLYLYIFIYIYMILTHYLYIKIYIINSMILQIRK